MQVAKKVVAKLEKCYALSELTYQGKHCFLVAAEKHDPCLLFSEDGELIDTVWEEPGGVMTMAPVPGADGQFLATHRFYSPNDSADASIVLASAGKPELGCISPFHGASLTIYHLDGDGRHVPQWKYPAPERDTEMIHATWADTICGKPTWVVGWRKGTRETIAITWDVEAGTYRTDTIDQATGCANALHYVNAAGQDVVVAANREIDEIALYTLSEEDNDA